MSVPSPTDDLGIASSMIAAARESDSRELRLLYAGEARRAHCRARARLDALEINLRAIEAELVRTAPTGDR